MPAILERAQGRPFVAIEEAIGTYHGNYLQLLRRQLLKLQQVVDPYERPNNTSFYYGLEISPVLRFTLRYGVVFPLGLAGLILSRKGWRTHGLLYVYLLAALAGFIPSRVVDRYRLAVVPVFLLYGAAALVWFHDAFRRRRIAPVVGGLGLVSVLSVAQHVWLPLARPEEYARPQEYDMSALLYASEGQFARAVAEVVLLKERLGQNPRYASVDLTSLAEGHYRALYAKQLFQEGKEEEARQQVELIRVAYVQHLNLPNPNLELGLLYFNLKEPEKARVFLERFLALEPLGARADRVRRLVAELKDTR
jgi:hypothetical protein